MGLMTGVALGVLGQPSCSQDDWSLKGQSVTCVSSSSPAPCPSQVMAERVLCPAAWEPWLLQGC